MTALERHRAMLEGRAVDHLPRIPILMQFAAQHIGATYADFCRDHRVKVEANLRCATDFGVDAVDVMSDPFTETQGFGAEIVFEENATPWCRNLPLEDTTDLSVLQHPDPRNSTRMRETVRTVECYRQQVGGRIPIIGWVEGPVAEAADLRGVGTFLVDMLEDPKWSCELMDLCTEVAINFARAQINAGADTIGIGDAIASQVSPDLYEQLILPRERRLVQAIRDMGATVRLHICGNITHLLPGISTLPINILDVDHMVVMKTVRQTLDPGVALAGNIDPLKVLRGRPEEIRHHVLQTYAEVGSPFFVNAGCEIPPGTPHENLRALCEPIAPSVATA